MNFDTIIVGAGNAGLSAALTLGRSRRRGLVLDGGPPRNVPAAHAHNFFTRDGIPPAELLRLGREQLQPYDGVEIRAALAQTARAVPGGFALELVDGTAVTARTLLLATGVVDVLPAIPGFRELLGRGVYHCPYCHDREVRDQPLALYGRGALGFHLAVLLYHWAPGPVLCTDGPAELDAAQLATLGQLGIRVLETPVAALEPAPAGGLTVAFADESRLAVAAVFARVPQQQRTDLAAQLGCAFTDDGIYIQTTWYGPDQRARRVRRRRPDQPVPAGGSRGRGRHGRGRGYHLLNNTLIFQDYAPAS